MNMDQKKSDKKICEFLSLTTDWNNSEDDLQKNKKSVDKSID